MRLNLNSKLTTIKQLKVFMKRNNNYRTLRAGLSFDFDNVS